MLAAQARIDAEAADELPFVLAAIEAALEANSPADPDLALALAQGWRAFRTLPRWDELDVAERVEHLEASLRAAPAIDASDARDFYGCHLAGALHDVLRDAGRDREATDVLERALERFAEDLEDRPRLLCQVADERRIQGEWSAAWDRVHEGELALEAVRAAARADAAVVERMLAGVRCQLELASGLVEQAARSCRRERAAIEAGADDLESRFSYLLDLSSLGFAQVLPQPLVEVLAELDGVLADPAALEGRKDFSAPLRARRALLRDQLESMTPVSEKTAARALEEALADEALDEKHRCVVRLRLVDVALRAGDFAGARRWLEGFGRGAEAYRGLPPELCLGVSAWRARVALAEGAPREELELRHRDAEERYREFIDSWNDSPARAGGVGFLVGRNRKLLLGALVDLCLALDPERGVERALEVVMVEQALGTLGRRLAAEPGTVQELREELLRGGAGVLVYVPTTPTRMRLLCLDSRTCQAFELEWLDALEQAPRALERELTASPAKLSRGERERQQERIALLSAELSTALLPAAVQARMATWKGVYVVGADFLGGVPFECLTASGKPLGTSVALAYLPSLPVGLTLARRARSDARARTADLLLVAATDLGPEFALPFTRDDEARMRSPFERASSLTGADATWPRILASLAEDPPLVLHLVAHGDSDFERELTAGLVLRGGRDARTRIWCEDVLESPTPFPPLVVLSACGSARGPQRTGDDGLAQLGGAMLSREARCVVQAVHEVALAPTLRLIEAFQRELAKGTSPAEALRAARAALARDPELAHPFYALSLRVNGLGLEPVFPSQR